MRHHWETGLVPVPWKHLGSVPQPFGVREFPDFDDTVMQLCR